MNVTPLLPCASCGCDATGTGPVVEKPTRRRVLTMI
jgi:hypothetical protein